MANIMRPQLDDLRVDELPNEHDFDDVPYTGEPVFSGTEETQPRYVHPQARRMFEACPCTRKFPLFGRASEGYGPACVSGLAASYLLCKGIADQTLRGATYSMLVGRYGISAERYQRLSPISSMGWSIKAFTAALCDTFACFGYTKRWYMFASCIAGAAFALAYGLLPKKQSSADTAAAFIFLSCWGKANVDILSEGHYSRLIRKHPEQGPALVSFIWWFVMLGSVVASAIYGPLADAGKQQDGIYVSAALQFVTGIIYLFNMYGEKINRIERAEDAEIIHEDFMRQREKMRLMQAEADHDLHELPPGKDLHPELDGANSDEALHDSIDDEDVGGSLSKGGNKLAIVPDEDSQDPGFEVPEPTPCMWGIFEINTEVAKRNWKVFVYSAIMTCAVVAMTCGNILADTLGMLLICVIVSVICCGTSFWALPLIIAKANVFGYLQEATYFQISVTDNFYMATEDCLPTGPHFSFTFYNTVANVIGGVAGMIGVTAFNYIFSKHSYRLAFISTTIIRVVSGVFDIIMVKRWNVDVGMPDHAMYICGDAIINQVCYMLNWMPMVILLSRLCPRGSESVVYALMAGFSNLGQSTSSIIAAAIMEWDWPVNTDAVPCTGFEDNLPWLLFVGHICTPLIAIPLTLLVPACRVCDDIDLEGHMVAKTMGLPEGAPADVGSAAGLENVEQPYGVRKDVTKASEPFVDRENGSAHSPRGV